MYNDTENRFVLERYRSGGSNRYVCPQCGRKKCFTRYVDLETGKYVADECGKCNHTASCGYHYPPRQYFHDHPEFSCKKDYQTEYVNGKPLLGLGNRHQWADEARNREMLSRKNRLLVQPQDRRQTEFFSPEWVQKAMLRPSAFSMWLEGLNIGGDARQVLADYCVGGTARDVVVQGVNYGRAVVFWLIDELQRVHDAKLIAYRNDGHRVQGWANTMRSICERSHVGPQLQNTEKVLFGQHLLPRYPDKTVCIVESEKTSLICACRYPQFLWLATGGCGNLQTDKLIPLQHRRLVVYPDSGEYDKWKEQMAKSGCRDYRVVDFMEQFEANTDIADILLGEAQQKPEFLLPPPPDVCPF